MAQVLVAELLTDPMGPAFEVGGVDFDGRTAVATGQMVMVGVNDAASVEALTTVGHDDVHLATGGQFLQLGVDRRERDLTAVAHDEGVQVLGADEALDPAEHAHDLATLGGVAGRTHPHSLPCARLQIRMIPVIIYGMIPNKARRLLALALMATLTATLVLFVRGSFGAGATRQAVVVTGVSQWGSLARQVAAPDLTVVSLLSDPNADPHDHEATVYDAANVSRATYVVLNGAGYDSWLSRLAALQGPQAHVLDVASLMGVVPGQNPHLFYDPRAARAMVRAFAIVVDAHGRYPDVARRASALVARLDALQARVAAIRSSCAGVRVAASEDVATYLLHDAGLRVVTPETLRLAVGNGVDPSVSDLALALHQLTTHPALLIDNVQTATPLTQQLVSQATRHHVPVIRVTETMTGRSYVGWMDEVLAQIERALHREGCLR